MYEKLSTECIILISLGRQHSLKRLHELKIWPIGMVSSSFVDLHREPSWLKTMLGYLLVEKRGPTRSVLLASLDWLPGWSIQELDDDSWTEANALLVHLHYTQTNHDRRSDPYRVIK